MQKDRDRSFAAAHADLAIFYVAASMMIIVRPGIMRSRSLGDLEKRDEADEEKEKTMVLKVNRKVVRGHEGTLV